MVICILGRQPHIGLAELESRFGSSNVTQLGKSAALISKEVADVPLQTLGGTLKVARHITTLSTTNWGVVTEYCSEKLANHLNHLPSGKVTLGISTYGVPITKQALQHTALSFKKTLKAAGRTTRIVPNQAHELNSAQVLHNKLTGPLGIELIIVTHQGKTHIGQTTAVQDIQAYAKRDYERPLRDAFVGMLPPKLAQVMLNLALGERPRQSTLVLDAFCGTGVVLQEAALMGCDVYGTDVSERMVRFTTENFQWLEQTYQLSPKHLLEIGDATVHQWRQPIDTVVSETYLGPPLSALPTPKKLDTIKQECNVLVAAFLQNLHPQLRKNTRICIAVPAWRKKYNRKEDFIHLPVIDDLNKLGYNRVRFSHSRTDGLVYYRSDQIVARELLVLTVI